MCEKTASRQCGCCYFGRSLAGRLHCVRFAPTLDPATGRACWPQVEPTDICGCFRYADDNPIEHDCWPRNTLPLYTDRFGDYCKIPLTQGRFAKVDPADYVWLAQFRWHCKANTDIIYAVRTIQVAGKSKRIYMHRQIMDTPEDLVCDHVNHDGLDNRRGNLRNCTTSQNNANRRCAPTATSQYLGVSWDKRRRKWVAYIKKEGKQRFLGSFDSEIDAAKAYDRAARRLHGPFAHLNFPEEHPAHPATGKPDAKSEARIAKSQATSKPKGSQAKSTGRG